MYSYIFGVINDTDWCEMMLKTSHVRHQDTQTVNAADIIHKNSANADKQVWIRVSVSCCLSANCDCVVPRSSCPRVRRGLRCMRGGFLMQRAGDLPMTWAQTHRDSQTTKRVWFQRSSLFDGFIPNKNVLHLNETKKSICYHTKCCLGCNRSSCSRMCYISRLMTEI